MELLPSIQKIGPFDQSQHAGVNLDTMSYTENPATWTERAWKEDYLSASWNTEFDRRLINNLVKPSHASMVKLLKLKPPPKTPRPALTFGLRPGAFNTHHHQLAVYSGVAAMQPGLYHQFFAVEAMNESGTRAEVELQCCWAGTAMVHCQRKLRMKANKPNEAQTSDEEPRSYVFTLDLTPKSATIYIHWVEVGAKSALVYHMHELGYYPLKMRKYVNILRQAIFNILDWGLFTRREEFSEVDARINEVQKQGKSPI